MKCYEVGKLRSRIKELKLSQKQIIEELNKVGIYMSQGQLSKVINGKATMYFEFMSAIATILHTTPEELFYIVSKDSLKRGDNDE